MKKGFTEITDVDLLIMVELSDKDLFRICFINRYFQQLAKREYFWQKRVLVKYGIHNKTINMDWKFYYISLVTRTGNLFKSYFDLPKVVDELLKGLVSKREEYYLSHKPKDSRDILIAPTVALPPLSKTYKYYTYIDLYIKFGIYGIYSSRKDFLKKHKKFPNNSIIELKFHF